MQITKCIKHHARRPLATIATAVARPLCPQSDKNVPL